MAFKLRENRSNRTDGQPDWVQYLMRPPSPSPSECHTINAMGRLLENLQYVLGRPAAFMPATYTGDHSVGTKFQAFSPSFLSSSCNEVWPFLRVRSLGANKYYIRPPDGENDERRVIL